MGGRAEGDAQRVRADALGEPGQRRFRMIAIIQGQTQIVWMEKEQLRRLGQALEQVLDNLPGGEALDLASDDAIEFEMETTYQFRAGRMELGYDEQRDRLLIIAHDIEAEPNDRPGFVCRITRAQAEQLAEEVDTVVSAGRPLCPLCGQPIGADPHVCAKQNGHFPRRLRDVDVDDDE